AQDGTADSSYNPVSVNSLVYIASRQADGKVLIGVSAVSGISSRALHRYNSDGSIDETFQPNIGINQNANRIVFQPDGKILVSGFFAKANGITKRGLARFNPDGTLDNSFHQTVFSSISTVSGLDLQSDGKILASEQGSGKAVRLNSDGSLDFTFSNSSNTPDIKALPDGKVLLALDSALRRYNSNGTFDPGFSIGTNGVIRRIELQPDGKILIAGAFTTVAGVSRGRIARLNSDITLDTSFNPPGGANSTINDIDLLPDGKILIGGSFTGVNFANRLRVARLNSDGSLDTAFNASPNAEVSVVKGDSNGKVLIGGFFTSVNNQTRRYYSKLNADGSIDLSFNQGCGANHPVFEIVLQQDNKILLGGNFYYVNGFSQAVGLVRLDNSTAVARTRFDFDGDGRADISVFRPSNNVWYQLLGPNYQFSQTNFGTSGDRVTPADFDGDGRTDLAIFRPSTGTWWYAASSQGNVFRAVQWGQSGDIPLPSDVNGDGKDDYVVYRPSNATWYRLIDGGGSSQINFGSSGDKPLIGDFDGDGKADPAIYRPSTGTWWYAASSAGNAFRAVQWGISEDIPVAADFDGDGKTDNAVYRPSNGVWYILNSGSGTATVIQFGLSADKPIAADYDGDGKADIAVYRPSTGEWYLLRSSAGFTGLQFGISEDIPIPNAFVP
ncbi:MAG: FG-GAP-like repeat-containing protein, partial [Pyrinomonadaceae bacterium]